MKIYLLRHGKAENISAENILADRDRKLLPAGKHKVRQVARGLLKLDVRIDVIEHSPLVRAVETAQIISTILKVPLPGHPNTLMLPESDPALFLRSLIKNHDPSVSLLMVGHEPFLSRLTSLVIANGHPMELEIKKAGIVRLNLEVTGVHWRACMDWLLPPRILVALGGV